MSNLNTPAIVSGPVTALDLEAARKHSTGRIYACPPCTMDHRCNQGRCAMQACAVEGGMHADPVPSGSVLSMRRHYRTRATVGLAVALAVTGFLLHIVWPVVSV